MRTTIINTIKEMDLEQILEDKIRTDLIKTVFDNKYYAVKTCKVKCEKLARRVDTQPLVIKRFVTELNIETYLGFAFSKAKEFKLTPQQIGILLVYSDEGTGKNRDGTYNYIRLAKQTGLQFDTVVNVLKYKNSLEISA